MVSCKQCATSNSLDSVFCKRCGAILAEDQVEEARIKLEALLKEGFHSFNEGRTDEALAIAETALVSDPGSVSALTLAADCHVRKGQIAPALELMERVVELNPDSELDKIKRNQLRSQLMTRLDVSESGDGRLALTAAIAAGIIVICLGAIWANYSNRLAETNAREALASRTASTTPSTSSNNILGSAGTSNPASSPTNGGWPAASNSGPSTATGDVQPIRSDGSSDSSGSRNDGIGDLPKFTGKLPLPGPINNNQPIEITPVNPEPPSRGVTVKPKVTQAPNKGEDPDPPTELGPIDDTSPATAERDNGVYEIAVSHPNGRTGTSRNDGPTAGGAEALTRTGVQQYQLGSYSSAAGTLERALSMGADPVSVNQRLGQAYEKLGKGNDAATAYKRAIAAGEAAIASGRGNKDRIQSAVDVCRQALRVIQGN